MSRGIKDTVTVSIRETTLVLWLVILAVALPTIACLWFMTRAMNNERAAMRQKSAQLHDFQLSKVKESLDHHIDQLAVARKVDANSDLFGSGLFAQIVGEGQCDSALIFNVDGSLEYPLLPETSFGDELTDAEDQVLEFHTTWLSKSEEGDDGSFVLPPVGPLLLQFQTDALRTVFDLQGRQLFPSLQLLALKQGQRSAVASLPEVVQSLEERLRSFTLKDPMPTAQKHFIADEMSALGYAVELPWRDAERLALQVLEEPLSRPERGILTKGSGNGDIWRLCSSDGRLLLLFHQHTMRQQLEDVANSVTDMNGIRIAINRSTPAGDKSDESIAQAMAGHRLPGWDIRIFPDKAGGHAGEFDRNLWVGAAIMMISIIGVVATFAIRRFVAQSRETELRSDFLSTVSHELKTPLTSIRMLVDTLVGGEYRNPERTRQYLEVIARENERLSALVETFLTYSQLESGRTNFHFVEVQPDEIAHQALDAVEQKFESADVDLHVDISPGLPTIEADDAMLTTALINFLDNAFKYSGKEKAIRLSVTNAGDRVRFSVTDNGIGLSAQDRERVLEKFFRSDTSHVHAVSGTGLGLSIVKYIIDAHKGTVAIESAVGQGSTFAFSIPVSTT